MPRTGHQSFEETRLQEAPLILLWSSFLLRNPMDSSRPCLSLRQVCAVRVPGLARHITADISDADLPLAGYKFS